MLHLLLIEDNPADVMLFREGLRQCEIPADVLIAHDGDQAIRILDEFKFQPDFVILDLNLPKFSGLELLQRYRGNLSCPVVVFTSSQKPDDRAKALELGAIEYVTKPVGFRPTTKLVGELLERLVRGESSQSAANS